MKEQRGTFVRESKIDVLRIIAALLVLFFHWFKTDGPVTEMIHPYDIQWAPDWLIEFSKYGFLGVDLFFILSGAVIGVTALGKKPNEFIRARFLRLFPTYFVAVVSAIAFLPLAYPIGPRNFYIPSLTGLQLWTGDASVLGVAWSLKFEVQWYLLVALAMWLLSLRKKLLDVTSLYVFMGLVLGFSLYFATLNVPVVSVALVLPFTFYFIFGAATKQYSHSGFHSKWVPIVLISGVFSASELNKRIVEVIPAWDSFSQKYLVCLIAVAVVGVVIGWKTPSKSVDGHQGIVARALQTGALMTYPLYLLHAETGQPLISVMANNGLAPQVAMLGGFTICILTSYAIVKIVDPMLRSFIVRRFMPVKKP
jgi:peptidoglycan/LPS O-acetylase OafA/YrhL